MRLVGKKEGSLGVESGRAEPGGTRHFYSFRLAIILSRFQLSWVLEDSWKPPLSTLLALGCGTVREAKGGLGLARGRGQVRFHLPAP